MSAAALETSALQESFIVTHGQMGFQLAHGVEHDTHHDQQAGTAEELGDHERNIELAVKEHGEECENQQEDGAACSHLGHGGIQEVRSGLSGADAGDVGTFLLEVVCDLQGVELVGNPEEAEDRINAP